MSQDRWAPPLPSNGRAGPRLILDKDNPDTKTYVGKLKAYYLEVKVQAGLTRWNRVPRRLLKSAWLPHRQEPKALADYSPPEQVQLFLANLYFKASDRMVDVLKRSSNPYPMIQRWLDTADGVVLPYLLEVEEEPNQEVVNDLTRFALENCANNYAQFISRLKAVKKLIRKAVSLQEELPVMRDMGTYLKYFRAYSPKDDERWKWAVHMNLWCQTRATGLADVHMAERSLRKFRQTVTSPDPVTEETLSHYSRSIKDATMCVRSIQGFHAKLSCGPKACLDNTQEAGGQTGALCTIIREKRAGYRYDPITLERERAPRRITSSKDVLDFCIQWVLENPGLSKLVKPHVVLEPSKARLITITPFAVSRIQGVVAHLLSPCLRQRYQTKSGMTKDRHLWNLFHKLHPQDTVWEKAMGYPALSTDMSNATDQHSRKFAKRIWREILWHLRDIEGVPLGLMKLAATIHTSSRYVVPCDGGRVKIDEIFKTSIGIFMGDFLTKPILTFNQDICARQARVNVYSIVGDDFVGIGEEDSLHTFLGASQELGNGVSLDDTYISSRYMFYCEELAMIPRTTKELPIVQMKCNQVKLNYIDTPRLRLLLPVSAETLSFSGVQAGRFALLGKETRWVLNTHPAVYPIYEKAQLLQHILLPQERDTMCPFTPEEIGGDGGFTNDLEFFKKVIDLKSRDRDEVYHRIGDLFHHREGMVLIRSESLNQVVSKYKAWLPTENALKAYLPKDIIVDITEANSSLRAITVKGFLEPPQRTFFKMVKAAYYRSILSGVPYEELPVLQYVDTLKEHPHRKGAPKYINLPMFLKHWRNPGFGRGQISSYLVQSYKVPEVDYLSMSWKFGLDPDAISLKDIARDYLIESSSSLVDQHGGNMLKAMLHDQDLPTVVRERLNLFVESDSIIKEELSRTIKVKEIPNIVVLVSRDQRLAAEIYRILVSHYEREDFEILCLRPCFYLFGRLEEALMLSTIAQGSVLNTEPHVIEDQGAMMFEDMVLFNEGDAPEWIWDPLQRYPTRFSGVWVVRSDRKGD